MKTLIKNRFWHVFSWFFMICYCHDTIVWSRKNEYNSKRQSNTHQIESYDHHPSELFAKVSSDKTDTCFQSQSLSQSRRSKSGLTNQEYFRYFSREQVLLAMMMMKCHWLLLRKETSIQLKVWVRKSKKNKSYKHPPIFRLSKITSENQQK